MKQILAMALMTLVASIVVLADLAPPERPSGRTEKPQGLVAAHMTIKLDRSATEARLVIPKSQVRQLRAELDAIDEPGNYAYAGFQKTQMIVAGTLMSLAFIFGGMWFIRKDKSHTSNGKIAAAIALASLGSMATLVYGNVGPPPEVRTINGKMFSESVHRYRSGSGRIKIETSDSDDVVLIVPDPRSPTAAEE